MRSVFVVQQGDGPGWSWKTVTGASTHAAATRLADELQHELDELSSQSPPVRVITTDELADEVRISGHAAEMLGRWPPWPNRE
jgi:hypothetical protein